MAHCQLAWVRALARIGSNARAGRHAIDNRAKTDPNSVPPDCAMARDEHVQCAGLRDDEAIPPFDPRLSFSNLWVRSRWGIAGQVNQLPIAFLGNLGHPRAPTTRNLRRLGVGRPLRNLRKNARRVDVSASANAKNQTLRAGPRVAKVRPWSLRRQGFSDGAQP